MAAPSYTHDLVDWIADSDTTAWGELTNATAGGAPDEVDAESALQGTNTVSQITNATTLCSMCRILASPVTLSAGQVFLVWHGHGVATALVNYASGGLRLAVATTLNDWKAWSVGGLDVPPHPYGKWVNNPIDPTVTAEYTNGTPPTGATNIYGVGSMCLLSLAVARGQPHVVDIIRYGRAEARMNGGETANYATFAGFAALNDATTARWGLIQRTDGGYLWKGLMTLGYSSAVDFRDSNKTIFIQDTRKVLSSFNKIEIRQASSRVDWTGITFSCLSPSTTASKGALQMIDASDVNIESCTFVDMDTLIFLSSATINNSVFRRTGQITAGGATFTSCTIDSNTASSAMLASSPANAALISSTTFTSDGTGHAIEITGTAANFTLTNNTYTGYASSDGSTGNEAVYVNIATGSLNLTVSGGSTPSVRTAGCTVTVITSSRTIKVAVTSVSGAVTGANVFLAAAAGGPFPSDATVTVTRSGTTATVAHTAHAMATNDQINLTGITDKTEDNGVHTITVTGANSYTYTTTSSGSTSYTGTIKSTFVFLKGLATAGADSNEISMTRTIPSNQPITGWARKSTSAPYYKQGAISGTVSSTGDTTFSPVLISDD